MKQLITILALSLSFSAMATDLKCTGTEPFWSLDIKKDTVTFSSPLEEEVSTVETITSSQEAHGYADGFAYQLKTDKDSTLSIITGACTDGMSEHVYPKNILYSTNGHLFHGCCEEAK